MSGGAAALFFSMWGAYVGGRRDLLSSLQDRAERAEAERELRREPARLAERSRIAGEMQDVLAHKVSLIALQAGALEANADAGSAVVESSAVLIRTTAKQAMEDLREVLGVLRVSPGGDDLAPQPDRADLDRLVQFSRTAGVRVSLTVSVPGPVPGPGRSRWRSDQDGPGTVTPGAVCTRYVMVTASGLRMVVG